MLNDKSPDFISDNIDCALHVGPDIDPSVIAVELAEVPRIVVASPELLARHPPVEDIDSLAALPWVALSTFYRREVTLHHIGSGERQAFTVLPRLSSDSLYAIRRTILNGLGVGMISAWAVEEDLREGRLVQLLPQWQAPALPVYLLYPWARYYPARLRRFLELMKAVMPELAGMRQVTATKKQGKAGNKKAGH